MKAVKAKKVGVAVKQPDGPKQPTQKAKPKTEKK